MKKIALIVGTRPEIIKVAPIFLEGQKSSKFSFELICTGQHSEMSELAFSTFALSPNIDLKLMKENQTSLSFLSSCLSALEEVFSKNLYDGVLVQGDTSSALAGALAAFHFKIPVAHLEAGLRTHIKYSPFPEEMNRCQISALADIHFCPTERAKQNLLKTGITQNVYQVGNSIVDAVKIIQNLISNQKTSVNSSVTALIERFKSIVLVTGHRRENFDLPMSNLCKALLEIRDRNPKTAIIFPVHPNPKVKDLVYNFLSGQQNIFLFEPLDYPTLINLIRLVDVIITDSGGIQEEAPCFGTPVIVTREATERLEAIESGFASLCPLNDTESLIQTCNLALKNKSKLISKQNPFGDGETSPRVIRILEDLW